MISIKLKQEIFVVCINIVTEKNKILQADLDELTDALKNDTKSSMGDKHETSRSMNQLEQEKIFNQLKENNKQLSVLQNLNLNQQSERIINGSLIETNKGLVFIATGLGKIKINNSDVIVISAESPLAAKLIGNKAGGEIKINNSVYIIQHFI